MVALIKGGILVEDATNQPAIPWNPKPETKVVDKKMVEQPKVMTLEEFLKANKKEKPTEVQGKGPVAGGKWGKKRCNLKWTPGAKDWAQDVVSLFNNHILEKKGRKHFEMVHVVAVQEGVVSCVGAALSLGWVYSCFSCFPFFLFVFSFIGQTAPFTFLGIALSKSNKLIRGSPVAR